MTSADKFQLHIYAALAQQEREFISTRTKAALQAAKARGTKLGGARPNQQARHDAVKALALENANRVAPIIMDQMKADKTYRYIGRAVKRSVSTNCTRWLMVCRYGAKLS